MTPAVQPLVPEAIVPDVEEEAAEEAPNETDVAPRNPTPRRRGKAGGVLAARAATEYLYVAQDMRRILAVAGALFATLVVLWVLIVVLRVIALPFY
jgi:hypothetical protein